MRLPFRQMSAAALILGAGLSVASAQDAGPFDFDLKIKFDAKAAARLSELGEKATVSAYYYGEPNADGAGNTNESGQISLGTEDFNISGETQTVTLVGAINTSALAWVVDGHPRVNVNVYSARKAVADNILNCDIFEDYISVGQRKSPNIKCTLLNP